MKPADLHPHGPEIGLGVTFAEGGLKLLRGFKPGFEADSDIVLHQMLEGFNHQRLVVGLWGNGSRNAVDEVDPNLRRPALDNFAEGGLCSVLDRKMAGRVVAHAVQT